jgi:uncharacterized protein YjbI with pentapeptide repeats
MHLLESHNQSPDCFSMELEAIPVSGSDDQFDLYLRCKFNQQEENILNGKVKFGLRGGELQLSLKNASILSIVDEINPNFTRVKNALKINPTWSIRAKPKAQIIEGKFPPKRIATVKIHEASYCVECIFVVKPSHIFLTDIEGLWKHNISPNKHGILDRKIALFLSKTYLINYVSKTIFASQDLNLESFSESKQREKKVKNATSELKTILTTVYQHPSNDFVELANYASLNLLSDFAGANLIGADLSQIDLNGANLTYCNFRGADLTDADLSEANLSYANLGGADLSGAYLEGSILHSSNLHSASLALANLIGADLTSANLQETNLTNTTLSNTKVKGAIFANNVGLTPETKKYLQEKGALFSVND